MRTNHSISLWGEQPSASTNGGTYSKNKPTSKKKQIQQPSACKADCLYCWPQGIIFKDSTPGCTEYTSFTSSQRTRPHTEFLGRHFALCPSKIAKEHSPLLSSHSQSIADVSASLVKSKENLCCTMYVAVCECVDGCSL